MAGSATSVDQCDRTAEVLAAVKRYWGYDSLLPLQAEAIDAGLRQRDSLVVLPTGGGKSLCYQVPPVVGGRMDVVVSPLISLMKDQVDSLRQCGYPAAAVHSNLTSGDRDEVRRGMSEGRYRLLFISPERLVTPRFLEFLARRDVQVFSIDEAHCISHWGHDFRPEYRQLSLLKERFPGASVHAYTATATQRVQTDIIAQLGLTDPQVLVGRFDRPNLVYRIIPSVDAYMQVLEVIRRHAGEAVIVYCITRKETEDLAEFLRANGVNAASYHAGMEKEQRSKTQEAFAQERLDVVVATVAFGMGIDRSDVRCVIHAAMPKSIEHYQQETGRAGRDGLEAECVLFYSAADAIKWQRIFTLGAQNADEPEEVTAAQLELLHHIRGLCGTLRCRHRALSRYFGQKYEEPNCEACDVCLGEVEGMDEGTTIAQKILSCIYRLGQRFGVGYTVQVLRGAETEQVRRNRHDQLTTYGLLADLTEKTLTNLVYQLVDQGLISRTEGDRPVLQLNEESMAVLRGEREVHLVEPAAGPMQKTRLAEVSWEGVDEALFERLRDLRREIARERSVPAYVIFGDA
ncbi:MAG: RecQ family ATP-dependent DNA helicase, partial [Phycisphaerales bacterium]